MDCSQPLHEMLISLPLHPLQLSVRLAQKRSEMAVSQFLIRFNHLPPGDHEFRFRLDDAFFRNREGSVIQEADVEVLAILHKGSGAMQLRLKMEGSVKVECVRCLEPLQLPVHFDQTLLIRMVDEPKPDDDDDDAIHIPKSAIDFDLERHLYDFITLQVPYSPVHPEIHNGQPGCNPEVLRLLEKTRKPGDDEGDDDRWSALKNIRLN